MLAVRSRITATLVAVAAALAACGGESGGPVVAGSQTEGETAAAAALGIIEPGVDVADEPGDPDAAEFRTGEDGEGLLVRDVVRTDASGFAQVDWFDGALARIDADTQYVLNELDATPGAAVVVTRLDVGRVWNRLRADEVERYEVVTDVATAAVRGTAFWVACDATGCTFAVLEGEVEISIEDDEDVVLAAGQEVTLDGDGLVDPAGPTDSADPWVVENARRDEAAGFDPLPEFDTTLACPLTAPEGWEEQPLEDPADPAAAFCRFVDPDASEVGSFDKVVWVAADGADFRETPTRNRPFYEETRDEILASNCAEGITDRYVAFDEAVGAGEVYGYAWYVARGPFDPGAMDCLNDLGASSYRIAVDGQVFQLMTLDGTAPCQPPFDGGDNAAWEAYVACRVDEFERRNDQFLALAAALLGG